MSGGGIAVFGCSFGDEGKGRVVDYLCSKLDDPAVVRFSGGPQAAHTVYLADGAYHTFSHFGSGTFRGARTYWSKYCPVDPVMFVEEEERLKNLGFDPEISIHPKCPVITPYEVDWNFRSNLVLHGTCGMGIYAVRRREEANWSLLVEDLLFPSVFELKLDMLENYYQTHIDDRKLGVFLDSCTEMMCSAGVDIPEVALPDKTNVVYEGSQGLLLDQNYGFFPHVTPSNTGSTNLVDNGLAPDVWLVTRAYQTRHGNGPMARMVNKNQIAPNPYEVNCDGGIQGDFRSTLLDLEMLRYAVRKDEYIHGSKKTLVVTCMDLVEKERRLRVGNRIVRLPDEEAFLYEIQVAVGAHDLYVSRSPMGDS